MPGPPPASLLGFLSLLGLLRSLGESEQAWSPRLSWDGLTPQLHLDESVDRADIAEAATGGLLKFGEKLRFPGPNPGVEISEMTQWQSTMDPEAVTAIGSDACTKKNDSAKADTTPLCMMYGAGHQEFLTRLGQATSLQESDRNDLREEVHVTLFTRWSYGDMLPKISFRWDPAEYHPHALQGTDPKKDVIQTVNGANRLAAVGFTAYECVPTTRGLATVSCMPYRRRLDTVVWPIWSQPLSLAEIKIVMRLPQIKKAASEKNDHVALEELRAYGIDSVMRATLFWDGKFKNVRMAELVA